MNKAHTASGSLHSSRHDLLLRITELAGESHGVELPGAFGSDRSLKQTGLGLESGWSAPGSAILAGTLWAGLVEVRGQDTCSRQRRGLREAMHGLGVAQAPP